MPTGSTPVRHCKQSNPGACLPACVRMVLDALGDKRTESDCAAALSSYSFGTPASRVTHLSRWGYTVQYKRFSLDELQTCLDDHLFPIVFVRADMLPWANYGGFHALVLVEITFDNIALHDPALDDGPTQLSTDGFLLAWEEFDCLAAVISNLE